ATRPEVVQALEQGALYALPPWPETYRVVATYGTLLNLDVRPLLRRIYAQVDAGVVGLAPKAMPDVPFMAPPEPATHDVKGQAPAAPAPARAGPGRCVRAEPPAQPGTGSAAWPENAPKSPASAASGTDAAASAVPECTAATSSAAAMAPAVERCAAWTRRAYGYPATA